MNYLIIRIKKIKQPYYTLNSRLFLIITTLLSTIIILTGFIQYTTVIGIVLIFVIAITYICIFVHTTLNPFFTMDVPADMFYPNKDCDVHHWKQNTTNPV